MSTKKLILASIITAVIGMAAVFLVGYAIRGFSVDGIFTAISIGLVSGIGTFIMYRKKPVKNCSLTRKQSG